MSIFLSFSKWNLDYVFDLPITHLHLGFSSVSRFPPVDYMTGQTSNRVIADLLAADLGKRHFSQWESKAQQEDIRRCGLSSSGSKYHKDTKAGRIALLTHLHSTPLPTEHLPVLRLITDLGLPPSGARSRQQFTYYLLCFMSVCLSVCLSFCLYVCMYVCLFACLPVCPCLCLCLSVCLSACLPVCVSVCICAWHHITISPCHHITMSQHHHITHATIPPLHHNLHYGVAQLRDSTTVGRASVVAVPGVYDTRHMYIVVRHNRWPLREATLSLSLFPSPSLYRCTGTGLLFIIYYLRIKYCMICLYFS